MKAEGLDEACVSEVLRGALSAAQSELRRVVCRSGRHMMCCKRHSCTYHIW